MTKGYHIIRGDQEYIAPESALTPEERAEIEERRKSPEARRRFGARLRRIRYREDAPLKAAMAILLKKKDAGKEMVLTNEELEACLHGAPEHMKELMRWLHRKKPE